MNRQGIILFFAALLLATPRSALSFQNTGKMDTLGTRSFVIAGNIYYGDSGKPAEHITIELRESEGTLHAPQTTTGTGGFEFRQLIRGNYALAIDVQGYERVDMPINVSFNSTRGLEIFLKPLAGATQPTKGPPVSAHELSMPQKARDLMESGKKKFYEAKDAKAALEDFQAAVAAAPDYYEAYYQIAMADLTLGDKGDAEKNLRKSIAVSEDKFGDADIGLGHVLNERGDFSGSEKVLLRGVALSPNSWLGFYELGRAQLSENQIPEARKSAEQARTLSPGSPPVHRLLSVIHYKEKNYTAMLQDLDAYIKLDPDSPTGQGAKKMRDQVQAKLANEKPTAPAEAKP